jgi:phosphate starvation-inducible protein PhoH and related proteins
VNLFETESYNSYDGEPEYVTPPKRERKRKVAKDQNGLSVKQISPKTYAQEMMMNAWGRGAHIVAEGSAGTGKSYIASYLALNHLLTKQCSKVVVMRSAVPTRDVGFLPGKLEEKIEVYTVPYKQIFNDLCENGTAWDILTKKNMVEFITTSYVRGITLDDCVIIVDEFQSMTSHELYSVLTRLGPNARVIVCGDTKQTDLDGRREKSCYDWFMAVTQKMTHWFEVVTFLRNDIVRSDFVRDLIIAVEE